MARDGIPATFEGLDHPWTLTDCWVGTPTGPDYQRPSKETVH
jgi:hypothetical protein